MSQEAIAGDVPDEFTFRPWNPQVESWDNFMGAVERGYTLFVGCCRHTITVEQTGQDAEPEAPDPDGESR